MGNRIKILDRYCGDLPLHLTFLVLYNIATNRVASIDFSLIWQESADKRS